MSQMSLQIAANVCLARYFDFGRKKIKARVISTSEEKKTFLFHIFSVFFIIIRANDRPYVTAGLAGVLPDICKI